MTANKNHLSSNQSNFILYTSNDGKIKVDVVLKDETEELEKESTISILETVQQEEYRVKTRYRTSQEIDFSVPHQQPTMRS